MVDTLKEAKGLGLAAPQIGASQRVFIVDLSAIDLTQTLKVFINPEIIDTGNEAVELEEGCLSFPGLYQKITRPSTERVRATDLEGNTYELEADGMFARAILHEFDHLEGVLFVDRMSALTRTMIKGRLKKLQKVS
jgi:peptide deformylase